MDKSLILNRIKKQKKFKKDTELANFLGISRAVLSNWYKRNTIDYELVLSKCEHMDLNELLKENNKEIIHEDIEEIPVKIIDNSSIGFILDRYEALAAENALLKQEVSDLKTSRGNNSNTSSYTVDSRKVSSHLAAEPSDHTRKD